MKLGLKQRMYNAEVRNRRVRLGLSQLHLAQKVGVSVGAVCAVETLRLCSPTAPVVVKLSVFFGVSPETLCPTWLKMVRDMPKEVDRQAEVTDMTLQVAMKRQLSLPGPETQEIEIDREFLKERLKSEMALLNFRERQALEMKYGIPDGREFTHVEIAKTMRITNSRVHQIVAAAMRKLQKPAFSRRLEAWVQ